jgi:PAS domain S-box-containing protein
MDDMRRTKADTHPQGELRRLKWLIIALAVLVLTLLQIYYYFWRHLSLGDSLVDWIIAMAIAILLIEITFRSVGRLQKRVHQEVVSRKLAERSLQASEKKFKALAEKSPNMIFINQRGRVVYANQRCEEIMGYTREEYYAPDFDFLGLIAPESLDTVKSSFGRHAQGEEVDSYEYTLITKDGRRIRAIANTKLIEYEGETAILGTATDVTERADAEEKLRRSERRLAIKNGIARAFLTTEDSSIYDQVLAIVIEGLRSEYGVFGFINEDVDLVCPSLTRDVWERCRVSDKRVVFPRESWGNTSWARALKMKKTQCSNARSLGLPEGHVPILRDLAVPIVFHGEAIGLFHVANKKTDYDKTDQELLEALADHVAPILKTRLERNIEKKKRKRVEKTLRESEEKYRALFESSPDGILIADAQTKRLDYANPSLCRMLGYSKKELQGLSVSDIHPQDDLNHVISEFEAQIRGEKALSENLRCLKKDGTMIYVDINSVVISVDGRKRLVGFFRDVTKRRHAEQMLREEQEKFRSLIETTSDWIWETDPSGVYTYASPKVRELFGYEPEEVVGKTPFDFMPPEEAHRVSELFSAIAESRQGFSRLENVNIHKDGGHVVLETSGAPVLDEAGNLLGYRGIDRDITDRKRAEEERTNLEAQLIQAHKLESVGQLAAGIAHEINTPTQYVGDNTHFLKDAFTDLVSLMDRYKELLLAGKTGSVTDDLVQTVEAAVEQADVGYLTEEIPRAIGESLEGVERISRIVRAMKDFSHPGKKEKTPIDINKAIETTIIVARNEWKYVADMVTDFDSSLPLVPCLPGDFNQVILNLITNAAHAIADVVGDGSQGKGTITVSTRPNGQWAEIRVSDTGPGIPEAIRNKVFDPFFTTKEVGKGTGQGLTISRSVIVDKHRGTLDFETEAGKGATFLIRLPLEEGITPKEPEEDATAQIAAC